MNEIKRFKILGLLIGMKKLQIFRKNEKYYI
jgi:hypothetical protein